MADGDALLRVYDDGPCETLLVAFSSLGGGAGGVSSHEFVRSAKRVGSTHSLFVRDLKQAWCLFGLGDGTAHDFGSVVDLIVAEMAVLRPQRR